MKAVKNKAEIEGYRSAMLKDGVAMVKFLKWLKPAVEAGGQTEISIDEKLTCYVPNRNCSEIFLLIRLPVMRSMEQLSIMRQLLKQMSF